MKLQNTNLNIRISSKLMNEFNSAVKETTSLTPSEILRGLMTKFVKDAWIVKGKVKMRDANV